MIPVRSQWIYLLSLTPKLDYYVLEILKNILVFWPHCASYRIFILQAGIKPLPLAAEAGVLSAGPPGKPQCSNFKPT